MPDRWQYVRTVSVKSQGHVWMVRRDDGRAGFFKFAHDRQWYYSGPLVANEWICCRLAQSLGFPVAEIELTAVHGPQGECPAGLVSVAADAPEHLSWARAPAHVKARPDLHLHRLTRLQQLVVFDAWTANVDRATGQNLILYRTDPADGYYDWYLIDHALSLYGAPYKWAQHDLSAAYWLDLWRCYHVPEGLLRWQEDWSVLEPMVRAVESLGADFIERVVDSVPVTPLDAPLRRFTIRLLMTRQERLRALLERWARYGGVKEYQRTDASS